MPVGKLQPISMEKTLNYMFKNLPERSTRKLENFDGHRRITVYRGDDYMNKITEILDPEHPLTFIRCMKNTGTKSEPKLKTAVTVLKGIEEEIQVFFKHWGQSDKGLRVDLYKGDDVSMPIWSKHYDNCATLRQDKYLARLFEKITGKKVL